MINLISIYCSHNRLFLSLRSPLLEDPPILAMPSYLSNTKKDKQKSVKELLHVNNVLYLFQIICGTLKSRTLRQFLERREIEKENKRIPCDRREIERSYYPK